jgi:hypothetical protein
LGRFLTPDPVGFSDGPNLYAYVHNSPLILIDPYGLTTLEDYGEGALECGREGICGAWNGYVHPFDTLSENSARAVAFLHDACRGDFSKVTGASRGEIAKFIGEGLGFGGAVASIPKMVVSGVGRGFAAFSRSIGKIFTRTSESNSKLLVATIGTKPLMQTESRVLEREVCRKLSNTRPSLHAESVSQKDLLAEHLRQYETYGKAGVKNFECGKIRYYGELNGAKTPGTMVGRRLVREWTPDKNAYRTWHETIDQKGRIRIVRPENNDGIKSHYLFDENGAYQGKR